MKKLYTITLLLASMLLSCGGGKGEVQKEGGLPILDLSQDYPEIELDIHKIADVEYIPLETTDESIIQTGIGAHISDKYIITYDYPGTIYFFDRKGKHIRTICNIGQGPQEHLSIRSFAVDFKKEEYYIEDRIKLYVYSFSGKWKRSFELPKNIHHNCMFNYDENHLIIDNMFHESFFQENQPADKTPYYLINKETGVYTSLPLTVEKRISRVLKRGIERMDENTSRTYIHDLFMMTPILANNHNFLIADFGLDTLYNLKDAKLTPIALRYPPVHSSSPPTVIAPTHYSDQFLFFRPVKITYIPEDKWSPYYNAPFMMWDRRTNNIVRVRLFDSNYSEWDITNNMRMQWIESDNYILFDFKTWRLCPALENGKLKGKLKEVASELKEDDNKVIVIYKIK